MLPQTEFGITCGRGAYFYYLEACIYAQRNELTYAI